MRRSGFARPQFERPPRAPATPLTRQCKVSDPRATAAAPVPKAAPVRSKSYRRYVATLPCDLCGVQGYSQACHGDADKGMGIKTCDLTCWPGCGQRPGIEGCHEIVSRRMSRPSRRGFEADAAARTRLTLTRQSADDAKLRALLVRLGVVQ